MRQRYQKRLLAAALVGYFLHPMPLHALDAPKGPVLLTITGRVQAGNSSGGAKFDLSMLQALPQKSFTTYTPWSPKPIKFTGPLLRDLLAAAKASGQTINALTLNDFQTSIPVSDTSAFDVIVAHHMDDQLIPVRTKGPLFIVYPYDSLPELRSKTYYWRSAWQLKSLDVE